jgi:thiamine biosynthesis lipoprotein
MKKRKNIKVTWLIALITVSSLLFTGCNIPFSKPMQAQSKTGLYFDTVITVTL